MRLASLLNELYKTKAFLEFKKMFPESFFCAGFFIIEDDCLFESTLDFFIPSKKRIASFKKPFEKFKIHEDVIEDSIEQSPKISPDLDTLCDKVREAISKDNKSFMLKRMIALISKGMWTVNCMGSGFGFLRVKIPANGHGEILVEKINFAAFSQ
ncbi:hypothetical protein D6829_01420 [Candidatus Pacearchaeota archaeon]|nr:MAG: hypothetical protein D6829_01420 [Candidatus Pacearchaeota archaeon]